MFLEIIIFNLCINIFIFFINFSTLFLLMLLIFIFAIFTFIIIGQIIADMKWSGREIGGGSERSSSRDLNLGHL